MSSYTEVQQSKNLTTAEKWKLGGHVLIGIGTLCLTISSLVQAISENTFSNLQPNFNTIRDKDPYQGPPAAEYFRGRL